ncbi:hypothetical protein HDF18_13695 [Mucilaginibacter sp. X5P1]|uniref:hypothetical protein n=1 Tax=Mucilaginibacter sp. X5P1 TaxID=2723088 RepID=UPI00182233D5|nr:hypothetical protein [Mucilaginibacter sp. X5P1]
MPKLDWGNLGLNQVALTNTNATEKSIFNKAVIKTNIKPITLSQKNRLLLSENIDFLTNAEGLWYVFKMKTWSR